MSIFKELPTSVIYFSDLINIQIYDYNQKKIGKLIDVFVDFEDIYPQILGLKIKLTIKL